MGFWSISFGGKLVPYQKIQKKKKKKERKYNRCLSPAACKGQGGAISDEIVKSQGRGGEVSDVGSYS